MHNSTSLGALRRTLLSVAASLGLFLTFDICSLRAQSPNLGFSSLVAGCPTTISLTANPLSTFWIAVDTGPGPVFVPGVGVVSLDLGANFVVLIDSPSLGITTDALGGFGVTVNVPLSLAGITLHTQAVVFSGMGLALSNAVPLAFVAPSPIVLTPAPAAVPAETFLAEDALFVDIDNDGDLDVAVANAGNAIPSSAGLQILINQGGAQSGSAGTLLDDSFTALNGFMYTSLCVAAADVDGDGDQDLFLGSDDGGVPSGSLNANNVLLVNQGGFQNGLIGRFQVDPLFPGGSYETQSAAFVDTDGDGDLDLVCGNGVDRVSLPQPCELFENLGAGVFSLSAAHFLTASWNLPGETDGVLFGDFDGDQSVDLVLVRDGADLLLVNNGLGVFSSANPALYPAPLDNSTGGAVGDFDQDGDLDVYITNIGQSDRLFRNNGALSFTATVVSSVGAVNLHMGCAAADFDQDGDLDLVVSTHSVGGPMDVPFLQINQGGLQGGTLGTFVTSLITSAPPEIYLGVAVGDVDGDGDLDVFLPSQGFFGTTAQDRLLLSGVCF